MIPVIERELFPHRTPERQANEEKRLVQRKAGLPARTGETGMSARSMEAALSALVMAACIKFQLLKNSIRVNSGKKSAMLNSSALQRAVAQLLDSIIVMTPLVIATAIAKMTGIEKFFSNHIGSPAIAAAFITAGIAFFLAWGMLYFIASEKLLGMTPGKAIAGVWGVGIASLIRSTRKSILDQFDKLIKRRTNSIAPSTLASFYGKRLWNFELLPITALTQHEPIPLPQSLIDI